MKPFIIECGIIHNRLQALVYLLSLKWLPPVTYKESKMQVGTSENIRMKSSEPCSEAQNSRNKDRDKRTKPWDERTRSQ